MSGNHSSTTFHNIELLIKGLGLERLGNTSLFFRSGLLVFSPAVAKNSQGYYWFDIREANIERKHTLSAEECLLLIRIVPDKFILCTFDDIQNIFDTPKIERSGKRKWEFLLTDGFTKIKNRNSDSAFSVHVMDKNGILTALGGK